MVGTNRTARERGAALAAPLILAVAVLGGAAAGIGLERAGVLDLTSEPEAAVLRPDTVSLFACPDDPVAIGVLTRGDRVVATGRDDTGEWLEIRSPLDLDERVWMEARHLDADKGTTPSDELDVAECDERSGPTTTTSTSSTTSSTTTTTEATTTTTTESTTTTTSTTVAPRLRITTLRVEPDPLPCQEHAEITVVTSSEATSVEMDYSLGQLSVEDVALTQVDARTWTGETIAFQNELFPGELFVEVTAEDDDDRVVATRTVDYTGCPPG